MDLGLAGKVFLVCGGSSGLGLGIAERLCREGARVTIAGRNAARLDAARARLAGLGAGAAAAEVADVARAADCERVVAATVARWGALHGVLANAAGPRSAPFVETTEADWEQAIALCLLPAVRHARAALPVKTAARSGRLLFLTSMAALQPAKNLILSTTVRAGVHGFAKSLADEVGAHGITVNCLCPGFTRTERLTELASDLARREGGTVAAVEARWAASAPLGRIGRVEELANAAAFLLSDAASFITGQKLVVDGGLVRAV
ncbi:MAG: SDR family oxidoreductase [Planctomycetes bacterium]|nr:SDR family oxidoreductase [Planctomycetota bacterium]